MGKKFDITPEQEKFSSDMADFVVEGVKSKANVFTWIRGW